MKFLDLDLTDVLVANFRESIRPAFPTIITLLSDNEKDARKTGADASSELSVQGKVCNLLT
jgi:hypothetical protein